MAFLADNPMWLTFIFAALVVPSRIVTSSAFGAAILPDAVLDERICCLDYRLQ